MDSILNPERQLAQHVAKTGTPDGLRQLFAARTARWKHWYYEGEASSGLFDDLLQQSRPEIAFELITTAVTITLEQNAQDSFVTALSLLVGLARASDTTEVPPMLQEKWLELQTGAVKYASNRDCLFLWAELARWYRVKPVSLLALE